MKLILRWLINAAALYVAVKLVPGIEASDTQAILIAAIVIGLINATLKPIAVLLTLPLTILTLGLFYLCVNGAMLYLAAALTLWSMWVYLHAAWPVMSQSQSEPKASRGDD